MLMNAHVPAEWSAHRALWVGFPSHEDLWAEDLAQAQSEVAALVRALGGPGGEHVRLMVAGAAAGAAARALLADVARLEVVQPNFGDVWLRDPGPIFLQREGEP